MFVGWWKHKIHDLMILFLLILYHFVTVYIKMIIDFLKEFFTCFSLMTTWFRAQVNHRGVKKHIFHCFGDECCPKWGFEKLTIVSITQCQSLYLIDLLASLKNQLFGHHFEMVKIFIFLHFFFFCSNLVHEPWPCPTPIECESVYQYHWLPRTCIELHCTQDFTVFTINQLIPVSSDSYSNILSKPIVFFDWVWQVCERTIDLNQPLEI